MPAELWSVRLSHRSLEESVGKPLYLIFRYVCSELVQTRLLPDHHHG